MPGNIGNLVSTGKLFVSDLQGGTNDRLFECGICIARKFRIRVLLCIDGFGYLVHRFAYALVLGFGTLPDIATGQWCVQRVGKFFVKQVGANTEVAAGIGQQILFKPFLVLVYGFACSIHRALQPVFVGIR